MTSETLERYETLSECLTMVEAMQRRFSRNAAIAAPLPGYELAWEQERHKAEIIRTMMRELRAGA